MMAATMDAFRRSLEGKDGAEITEIAVSLFSAKKELEIRLKETENASSAMAIEYQQMKDELNGARKEIEVLRKLNQHLTGIQTIQTNDLFGRSTEKTEDILNQVFDGNLPQKDPLAEDAEEQKEEKRVNRHRIGEITPLFGDLDARKQAGRKKRMDVSGLEVQHFFDYDIDKLNKQYGEGQWRFAYWKEERKVELIHQTTYLKVTYTPIVSVGLDHQLIRIPTEDALIPKSVASASLLAQIMLDWNRMYLPLYRQESDPNRFGFALSRQTMSNWILYVAQTHLRRVYEYLCQQLKGYRYQNCDETYYSVTLDERGPGAKSFIWVHRSGDLADVPQIVVYCYEKTRSADHLRDFYAGLQEMIYLTCDAYSAYPCYADESNGLIILTRCHMHCRRRFVEALLILNLKGLTDEQILDLPEAQAILLIRKIYLAEGQLKNLSPEERLERRKAEVLPKVNAFFAFVRNIDLSNPLLSEKMKDAVQYALNQETYLRRFLTDGNIPIDNGIAERSVKPVALYRRNSLFSFSVKGAESMAMIFSLIETARANGADPYFYLKYLMEKMPKHLYDKECEYMPDLMPWSDVYRRYESEERLNLVKAQAPPGNERPRTPKKRKTIFQSA